MVEPELTEQEWLAGIDLSAMLNHLILESNRRYFAGCGTADRRKPRLFACQCCRNIWNLLDDERSRRAVEVAEEFADGRSTNKLLRRAGRAARRVFLKPRDADRPGRYYAARAAASLTFKEAFSSASHAAEGADLALFTVERGIIPKSALDADVFAYVKRYPFRAEHVVWLLDIFGNPFRPVSLDPRWLSSTAVSLAQAIYTDRLFDRMPILADALEDAGCHQADILGHCRGGGEHVRGCWVVDLLLGKE